MYILFSSLMIYFSSQQEKKNQVCDLINLYLGRPTSMICETDVKMTDSFATQLNHFSVLNVQTYAKTRSNPKNT